MFIVEFYFFLFISMTDRLDTNTDEVDAMHEGIDTPSFPSIAVALAHMTREQREEMEHKLMVLELRRERLAA